MRHIEPKPATILAAVLAVENLADVSSYRNAKDAESLVRLGKRAQRIAVQKCNGIERYDPHWKQTFANWTDADEARAEKAIAKIQREAEAILAPYGAADISAHGDPRGFCLTFKLASGRTNSFSGDVWGV